jgi:hypothetical protein
VCSGEISNDSLQFVVFHGIGQGLRQLGCIIISKDSERIYLFCALICETIDSRDAAVPTGKEFVIINGNWLEKGVILTSIFSIPTIG